MYKMIRASKELSRGVFWDIDGELFAYPFYEDATDGVAKSGNTFNHKKLWQAINPTRSSIPYNYYPRGRVEITRNGKAVVYLNPNIEKDMLSQIRVEFGIREEPKVVYDYSDHYKCYLDEGWKPDK